MTVLAAWSVALEVCVLLDRVQACLAMPLVSCKWHPAWCNTFLGISPCTTWYTVDAQVSRWESVRCLDLHACVLAHIYMFWRVQARSLA